MVSTGWVTSDDAGVGGGERLMLEEGVSDGEELLLTETGCVGLDGFEDAFDSFLRRSNGVDMVTSQTP